MSRSVWKWRNIGIRCDASVAAAPARPTFEDEERIGSGIAAQGRRDDDLQVDGPTGCRRAILEDAVGAAIRVGWTLVNPAGMQSIERALTGTLTRGRKDQRDQNQREAHPGSLHHKGRTHG